MKLSVIVPILNEEPALPMLLGELRKVLQRIEWDYEIIAVDDGSTDRSLEILLEIGSGDDRIKVISFSRNFGHQAAITAGMDFASGDAVVLIDADLQDPPELIPQMLALYDQGYDVVSPQRIAREGDGWFKRKTASCFYWLLRKGVDSRIQSEIGDFRLLSRRVVEALRSCREHQRFLRGLVAWLGFREATIQFERRPRAAGETKYPVWKMFRFAWAAITSFSALPLRFSIVMGVVSSALAFLYFAWALYAALILKRVVPGWTSIVALQSLSVGVILLSLGLIGEYIANIYEESKKRPLYVVQDLQNLNINGSDHAQVLEMPDIARMIKDLGPASAVGHD
jgi:polyisoprenyl-phosphate glycosyltransferase